MALFDDSEIASLVKQKEYFPNWFAASKRANPWAGISSPEWQEQRQALGDQIWIKWNPVAGASVISM